MPKVWARILVKMAKKKYLQVSTYFLWFVLLQDVDDDDQSLPAVVQSSALVKLL